MQMTNKKKKTRNTYIVLWNVFKTGKYRFSKPLTNTFFSELLKAINKA